MKTIDEIICQVFSECEIQLEGQTISRELILKTFGDYLTQTIDKNEHNIGLIMHTGSVCFDSMLLMYAAILNLISNKVETEDVINSISIGDTVLYGHAKKKRYEFKGFVDAADIGGIKGEKLIKLIQGNSATTYVLENDWRSIEPYYGKSVRMDGRGIRKKSTIRDDFFVDVLGYARESIPSVIDTSCVVVASREYADYLIKNLGMVFGDKKIGLLDLVTASYFTEEGEYRYGGNAGKNEAIIKFSAKVSTARHLLLSRNGNRHLGLVVLGEESIYRGFSELPELINRKSLRYVYISSAMDSNLGMDLIADIEDPEMFVCTKEFLLEHTTYNRVDDNRFTEELSSQVNTIVEKNNDLCVVDEGITKETFCQFKNNMIMIKRDEFSTDEKENFIMLAHSLMKLFVTAPFPMNIFLSAREQGIIDIDTPADKLNELKRISVTLPDHIQKNASEVIKILEVIMDQMMDSNGKYEWIQNYLYTHINEKIAFVVPKAYYITLIKGADLFSEHLFRNKEIVTVNRFNNAKRYDRVIILGDYEGKYFNAFRCISAPSIISVIYECERSSYYFKNKVFQKWINQLQEKSTINITDTDIDNEIIRDEEGADSYEKELEEYISNVDLTYINTGNRNISRYEGTINAEIVAVVVFDDDTKAYLSKHYRGYVLEESTGTVKEVGADEFCEGDSIVFTKNNDETKDIVSSILAKLFLDGRLDKQTEENYKKANLWKNSLVDFMYANNYTARKVAELMHNDGSTVHEQTILRWLDEDAHTVGPRMVESIRHIGNVTGVEELIENADGVYEACREIRAIRRRILDQVGAAIVERLSGNTPKTGTDMETVYEKVDKLAEVKRVERIARVDMTVPMGIANRPFSV